MSGYLFKRASNAFKSWSRRWFILRDNRIVYQSESKAEVKQQLAAATLNYSPMHIIPSLPSYIPRPSHFFEHFKNTERPGYEAMLLLVVYF